MFAGLSQILASCFAATVNSTVLTPGGGAVTPTVSFRAFDPGTKKWVLLASLSGCIMRASFLGTGNNFSCVVFRKEKNREFPGSSRLESY